MRKLIFICFIFLLFSCSDEYSSNYRNRNSDINIYLVQEGQLEIHDSEVDLNTLELERFPWVKDTEIEFYDWSAHTFYLNREKAKSDLGGRHFVVTSGEKRLFVGVFFPMYLSSVPSMPSVLPDDGYFAPKDVIQFNRFGHFYPIDLDAKTAFKSELFDAGLLRAGIDVKLTQLKKLNSTTLEYTYTVVNRDLEPIYILDSDKMHADRFHYFTNGVSFRYYNKNYWAQNFETTASEEINEAWYYKLLPGKSITRTLEIDGFESIPSGKVEAAFRFPGANLKKTGEWKKQDGRIWLGSFMTEQEIILR